MNEAERLRSTLLDAEGATHAFFTRRGGVSRGVYESLNGGLGSRDQLDALEENRRRMAEALGVSADRLLIPFQIHSADALIVDKPFEPDGRPRCDALVSRTRGLAIGVTGADCGMILFHDPTAGVVGAAHAGWKGALGGVLEATLAAMERLGARRDLTRAALGPTIAAASYEVGPEFEARFAEADSDSRSCFRRREGGRPLFDLPGYIRLRLRRTGLAAFEDLRLDTYADEDRFFSYRRSQHRSEPDYGRLVAAIALV